MARAGDSERERAAARLREHFVGGRLTVDELEERVELALQARSTGDLRRALRGLPELAGQTFVQVVVRGAALVVLTGAWLAFSFALLAVLALTLLIQGASVAALLAFLLVWLVPTLLLSRLWHRSLRRTSSVYGREAMR
jgi:DUF1707 SHOCT-like domain